MATLVVSNAFAGPETALREFAGGQIKKGVRTIGMGGDGATTGNYALVYKRPKFAAHERGMLVLLARLLPRWRDAVLLVKPQTILRWHREGFRTLWRWKSKQKSPTSKLPAETIPLIRRMAEENRLWGAERIRGELLKLGIRVAKRTVQRYMRVLRRRPCQLLVLDERHLLEVLVEYCRYFNESRPHQGIGQLVPTGAPSATRGNGYGRRDRVSERAPSRLPEGGVTIVVLTSSADGRGSQHTPRVSTSTLKKSAAAMAPQCALRKVFRGIVFPRSGAGSVPCSVRMRWMVDRPRSKPRFSSAPRSRV